MNTPANGPTSEISRVANSLRKPLLASTVRRSPMNDDRRAAAPTLTGRPPPRFSMIVVGSGHIDQSIHHDHGLHGCSPDQATAGVGVGADAPPGDLGAPRWPCPP